ncbi:MAG: pyridoxal phosphate-dependent aminotransferase [Acidobacteriia bacterium]|nr:pyridoxal phosphate-dependent aminotransferase [Terriglobia bacterium]
MFSTRLDWSLPSNALAMMLARKRAAGCAIIDLTESNPARAGIALKDKEILEALTDAASLTYEPSASGLERARQSVADYYAGLDANVSTSDILLTASTSEAYSYLFKLLADPGDEILVPRPSYPLFEHLAALESVRVLNYPLHYQEGWWIDLEELERRVSARTRAIVVVNPNNPTGSYVKQSEFAALANLCRRNHLALISDEVFTDYALIEDAQRVPTVTGNSAVLSFALSGLSKLTGLPQMKLGWMVVGGPGKQEALHRLEWIADTYLSVSAPVQHAAPAWMKLRPEFLARMLTRLRENLAVVRSEMETLRLEGGWYATLRLPSTRSDSEWALRLLDADTVLVQPGFFYDVEQESLVVVSLLTEPSLFREGIHRILGRINE